MLARQPPPAETDATAEDAEDDRIMAEVETDGGISHAAMSAWLSSWGGADELPPPKAGD